MMGDPVYNTIVDIRSGGFWIAGHWKNNLYNGANNTDVKCNVVINGERGDYGASIGSEFDYNAFYNTLGRIANPGTNDIVRGTAAEAKNAQYCFTTKILTNPTNVCLPNAKTTVNSPHVNLCAEANIGSRSDIGVDESLYTQAGAGFFGE